LTARVNPTIHDAMQRIEHAGDGGPSRVGLTLAVNLESGVGNP